MLGEIPSLDIKEKIKDLEVAGFLFCALRYL